jgi:mono/diheme cytochrome c family protein
MKLVLLSAALLALCSPSRAADVQNGKRLSEQWCASCHVVSAEQRSASTDVPGFSEIGRQGSFDAARLALFLLEPHPRMPSMALTRSEAADIAAYIKVLGSK